MNKIDLKLSDLLSRNCRLSLATLATSLNLSKDTIKKRIENLEKQKAITHYNTIVDLRTLGVSKFHIFLKLKPGTSVQEVIKKIKEHPSIQFMNTLIGKYDIQIIIDDFGIKEFEKTKREIIKKIGKNIQEYTSLNYSYDIKHTNKLPETDLKTKYPIKSDFSFSKYLNEDWELKEDYDNNSIDNLDVSILEELTKNPKESLTNISIKYKVNRETIKNRIIKLIQKSIIKNFGANLSFDKFSYISYLLLIKTNEQKEKEEMAKAIQGNKDIFYSAKLQGSYDLSIYLLAKSPGDLKKSIDDLQKKIGNGITSIDLLIFDEIITYTQLPKKVLNKLKNKNS